MEFTLYQLAVRCFYWFLGVSGPQGRAQGDGRLSARSGVAIWERNLAKPRGVGRRAVREPILILAAPRL